MTFRSKCETICLETIAGKNLTALRDRMFKAVLEEFKKKDGMFDSAWNKILQESKGSLVKAMVIEVIKEMPIEERKQLLNENP